MPVSTACKSCSARIKVKDELVGKSIKCPKCGMAFKVTPVEVEEKAAVKAAPESKAPTKPPPPAWDDNDDEEADKEDEKSAPWDKKDKSKQAEKKSLKKPPPRSDDDDDEDAPTPKAKVEDNDEEGDDEDVGFEAMLAATQLSDSMKKRIRSELSLRETGIWVGQPCPKIMTVRALGKSAIGLFFISVFTLIISIGGGMAMERLWFLAVGGALCFWVTLAILLGAGIPFMDRRKALATAYVVTNKRAIAFTGRWFGEPSQESFYPDLLQHMRRMKSWVFGADSGDLVFRSVTTITTTHHSKGGTSTSVSTTYYGFLGIRNLDEAERIIRQALLTDDDDDDDDDDRPRKKKKKKRRDDDDDDD